MFQQTKEGLEEGVAQIETSNLAQYARMSVRNRPYTFTDRILPFFAQKRQGVSALVAKNSRSKPLHAVDVT